MSKYKISDTYTVNNNGARPKLYCGKSSPKGHQHRSFSIGSLSFPHLTNLEISEPLKSPSLELTSSSGSFEFFHFSQTPKGQPLTYDNMYGYKDQYDCVGKHTEKGLEFLDRYASFLKKRCDIETNYASELKRLVRSYQPKRKEKDEIQYSSERGFQEMLKEVHDMAGQHEVIVENTQAQLIADIQKFIIEVKTERRKAKRNYERKFGDAERAFEAFKKADADINLSRADVERTRSASNRKSQEAEESKNEYASQLQNTNQVQQDYYTVQMPAVFKQLQDLDESRINKIKSVITQSANIEAGIIPIINTCIEGIHKAAQSISASQDSKIVVDKYKTGFSIPTDIPFDDLANPNSLNGGGNSIKTVVLDGYKTTSKSSGGTLTGGKKKDRKGLFGIFGGKPTNNDEQREDFSHIPPAQRKAKLLKKIDEIKGKVGHETAEREGMVKLMEVYKANLQLGDPGSIEAKLQQNAEKLNALQAELRKYQDYLLDAESNMNTNSNSSITRHGSSDSMTHSITSDNSIHLTVPGTPNQQHNQEEYYEPVEDPPITATEPVLDVDSDEFMYTVIGSCRALYPFDASNEGSVGMSENEEMWILEQDQGDGWTRVRKHNNSEGFVPTSYIQCHFYDQDAV